MLLYLMFADHGYLQHAVAALNKDQVLKYHT